VLLVGVPPTEIVECEPGDSSAPLEAIGPTFVELLGAGGELDTTVFTIAALLGGAAGSPRGGCAGPEDDGDPGPARPPAAVEEGGSDPAPTAAGGAEAEGPPLTAGAPASDPAPAPGGEQFGAGAPTAPAVPLLFADPAGSEHEPPEFSPDELTVGPLPDGAVPVADGVVVVEAGGVAGGADGVAGGWAVGGEAGAVPASEPVPAEQSVGPAEVPPAVVGAA
jgi:hypothetical protein